MAKDTKKSEKVDTPQQKAAGTTVKLGKYKPVPKFNGCKGC